MQTSPASPASVQSESARTGCCSLIGRRSRFTRSHGGPTPPWNAPFTLPSPSVCVCERWSASHRGSSQQRRGVDLHSNTSHTHTCMFMTAGFLEDDSSACRMEDGSKNKTRTIYFFTCFRMISLSRNGEKRRGV